ncbi:IPT/TIG domain-containing protein [Actinacidiphila acididurans]|uniref:IPT/TIG domain-containing protein n=1 Tax=Actinacidiphila acididurans TaxID=2784346 RepID=A0ABS2U068_9ACTN|nr:IPT/TIG domain-containing protein [Actinacidiphila acididurans]MBM9508722.1 IPT/TIG domain-containing protein [Actinacidiphila acididurans]
MVGTVISVLAGLLVYAPAAAAGTAHSTSRPGAPLRHSSITRGRPAAPASAPVIRKVRDRTGAMVAQAAPRAAGPGPVRPVLITFSELAYGTSVSDQYAPAGIVFGGDAPFITGDGSNPTSPVLSGSPLFQGNIDGTFVQPDGTARTVSGFSLDVGYIDNPGSIEIDAIGANGNVLETVSANQLGIVRVNVNLPGIAGFEVHAVADESAGFAIDNVSFPGWGAANGGGPATDEQGGATNPSEHPTTCFTADPVNCATGDFFHQFDDVSVPGRGVPLDLYRTYDAERAAADGPFGNGWTFSYGMTLTTGADGSVGISQENGSLVTFSPDGSGGYTAGSRVLAGLTQEADGTWQFTRRASGDTFVFDAAGRLTAESDRNGETTSLSYADGHLSTVTDPAGRTLGFAWSGTHIVSVTDPMSRTYGYAYDADGNLLTATDRAGRAWHFGYDAAHLLTTMTDPRGGAVHNTYDAQARVTDQTDQAGLTTHWAWSGDPASDDGAVNAVTDPHGAVTVYAYSDLELVSVTHGAGTPAAASTYYAYDPATLGRTQIVDPDGATTTNSYDADGNLISSTDPTGATTSYGYNGADQVTYRQSAMSQWTWYEYDGSGNLTRTGYADGSGDTYAHDDPAHPGDVTALTDPDGRTREVTYDSYGDIVSVTRHPDATTAQTTVSRYDADGELVCTVSATAHAAGADCPADGSRAPHTATSTYDPDGLLTAVTDPNAGRTQYGYDADTNRTGVTDPKGNVTATEYDADGRTLTVTKGAGGSAPSVTATAYDIAAGADGCTGTDVLYCTATTDAKGARTVDGYDARGDLVLTARPGGHTTRYTYDLAGLRITRTDPAGRTTDYGYDGDGRPLSVHYPDAGTPDVAYAYDLDGHRTSMTDGTGTTGYTYDGRGRLSSVQDGAGHSVGYDIDPAGDLVAINYPNGQTLQRSYDGADRLASVTDWNGLETTFGYDADGNPTRTTYPNGDTVATAYDAAGQESGTAVRNADNSVLASVGYARDADALVTAETDGGALTGSTSYAYDDQNRLTAAHGASYAYDKAGNATGFAQAVQSFDASGQLTSAVTGSTGTNYGYDANGERTSSTPVLDTATHLLGAATSYGYDDEGRLTSVTAPVPTVTKVAPASGPAAGGTAVTVTGTALSQTTAVAFGHTAAAFKVTGPGTLTATAPKGTGTVDITVTTPYGTTAVTAADRFTYLPAPAVTKVSPTTGPTTGGTKVTVTGSGFTGATAVLFGTKAAKFTVTSSTVLTATAPAGTGTLDIRVTTPNGTSAASAADRFAYFLTPAVGKVSPSAGPLRGGTTVTITGTGLSGASAVHFGSVAVRPTASTASTVTVKSPAHVAGPIDVTVTTAHGTSPKVTADRFTYDAQPVVTKVSPASGTRAGNTTVTVTGRNFTGATSVHFGSRAGTRLGVWSSTRITVRSPSGTGTVDITVTSPGGTSVKGRADRFTYTTPTRRASYAAAAPRAVGAADPVPGPGQTRYTYDGDGLRTAKTTAAGTEEFVWGAGPDGAQLLADGPVSFVYGPGGRVIEQISDTGGPSASAWYFTDALGSTRALLGQDGSVTATYGYDAYGRTVTHTGTATTPLRFGGGYTDAETGFVLLVQRYYDPGTGQFLTVDPAVALTLSPYAYADGDPANLIDPSGLWGVNPVSWVVDHAGDISAVTGTLAVVIAPIPGLDVASLVLGGISVATGAIATAKDIHDGNYVQAAVDGIGTVVGGAGFGVDLAARGLQGAARAAWDAGAPVLDLARQAETWERRGTLIDRAAAGLADFGDWTDHEKLFEHEKTDC